MQKIITLAKELAEKRDQVNISKEHLDQLKLEKDKLQSDLMEMMAVNELKSLKTNTYNYSMTAKKDIRVIDPQKVIESLKEKGIYDDYVEPKLNTIMFKGMAKELLKQEGEVFAGTEPTITTYISIKKVK